MVALYDFETLLVFIIPQFLGFQLNFYPVKNFSSQKGKLFSRSIKTYIFNSACLCLLKNLFFAEELRSFQNNNNFLKNLSLTIIF